MDLLHSPDTIAAVVSSIYEAAYDPALWPAAVTRLRDAFHGSKACLGHLGPNIPSTDAVVAPDSDPGWAALYFEQFADNELIEQVERAPVGLIYSDHALVGHERMRAGKFWNEWMAPQDMYGGLGCKLQLSDDVFCILDIQRGRKQPAFGAEDAESLQRIVPHLMRAGELGRQFQTTRSLASAFSYLPFGVILVDGTMTILGMNTAAELILARPACALSARRGRLSAGNPLHTSALERIVAQVCTLTEGVLPGPGGDFAVKAPEGGGDLVLSIGPLTHAPVYGLPAVPCAAVFVRDLMSAPPRGFETHIRQVFALSPKEAAIAAALAAGLRLKDIAVRENITLGTARFYLHHIFRKTNTRQQSHLVSLLKSMQPIISHD